jgi:hypothetical protein
MSEPKGQISGRLRVKDAQSGPPSAPLLSGAAPGVPGQDCADLTVPASEKKAHKLLAAEIVSNRADQAETILKLDRRKAELEALIALRTVISRPFPMRP